MQLENTFTVPVPPKQAFEVLRDIERIGPCMPGASIDSVEGDHFTGKVKVKIGPIQVTYRGEAEYTDVDPDGLTATIDARGRESRGAGTANATVRATITDGPDGGSQVHVVTDLAITGKPAQFGRGVMADVGEKLLGRFADCLSQELGRDAADDSVPGEADATAAAETTSIGDASTVGAAAGGGSTAGSSSGNGSSPAATASPAAGSATGSSAATASGSAARRERPGSDEAIDLLEVAGAPLAQRIVPVLAGLLVLWLLKRLLGRRGD